MARYKNHKLPVLRGRLVCDVRRRNYEEVGFAGTRISCLRLRFNDFLSFVKIGKVFFQAFEFGEVVVDDVWICGIAHQKILVIVLGGIKGFKRFDFGDDGSRIDFASAKLGDVSLGDALLFIARVENRGALLRTGVRALAIPLRWIMHDRKENHQQLAVGDLRWIESDANGFGVARDAHTDSFVGAPASASRWL